MVSRTTRLSRSTSSLRLVLFVAPPGGGEDVNDRAAPRGSVAANCTCCCRWFAGAGGGDEQGRV